MGSKHCPGHPRHPVRRHLRRRRPAHRSSRPCSWSRVLAGSALFASGFTLGMQQSLAPGTSAGEQQMFDPFWEAYRKISAEYVGGYDPKLLVEGAIKGMFGALDDPYSSYMTSQEYRDSLSGISGEFEGIGATMSALDEQPAGLRTTGTRLPPRRRERHRGLTGAGRRGPHGRPADRRRRGQRSRARPSTRPCGTCAVPRAPTFACRCCAGMNRSS